MHLSPLARKGHTLTRINAPESGFPDSVALFGGFSKGNSFI